MHADGTFWAHDGPGTLLIYQRGLDHRKHIIRVLRPDLPVGQITIGIGVLIVDGRYDLGLLKLYPEDSAGNIKRIYVPFFFRQYQEYQDATLKQEVGRQVAEASRQTAQTHTQTAQTQNLERKQIKHYERAKETGARDYGEVEDKAIAVLGNDVVNHLIANFDDSHVLLYYLGKNPGEAARIADTIQSNPIQGVAEIGALRSELKIKPKSNNTPDPDEELEGGSPGGNFDAKEKKLEKLREEAKKTGNMKKLMAFKRKLKEQVKT